MIPRHPIKTPRLTGPQVGWLVPTLSVIAALLIPALLAVVFLFWGTPNISGPPKDGSAITFGSHVGFVLAALAASFLVTWMLAPVALLLLRAAAMLGYAGWGMAIITSLMLGLPTVHIALMGDLTTEDPSLLPHISMAIVLLGLSVWGAFWGLMAWRTKRTNFASI